MDENPIVLSTRAAGCTKHISLPSVNGLSNKDEAGCRASTAEGDGLSFIKGCGNFYDQEISLSDS